MATKITVDIPNPKGVAKRILTDDVKLYANTRLHAYCSPYVPMDSGTLDQTVNITKGYVHYKAPYAHYMYEGEVYGPNYPIMEGGQVVGWASPPQKHPTGQPLDYSTDKHPLATSHWDKAMKVSKGQQLADDITAYLKRK